MNRLMTLGMVLSVSALLTGCQKEEKPTAAQKATAPAPAPVDRSSLGNMVTLSELQKGEVIRGGVLESPPTAQESKPLNYAKPLEEKNPATPLLSYSDIMDCRSGSCRINDLEEANHKSESLKGMLRHIPLLHHTAKAEPAPAEAQAEAFEEQSLLAGEAGNFNDIKLPESALSTTGENIDIPEVPPEMKLPGSGHSRLPAADLSQRDLWPGGIPLEAEIDPAVTGF